MVKAYHVIFGTYGFWLPNDPRGSWSDWVYAWELFRYGGPATKVDTVRSVAGDRHNVEARLSAKERLKYPAVVFNDAQIASVAAGFERMAKKSKYKLLACAILPEHVHMVLGRHNYKVETMVRLLKGEASTVLREVGIHPMKSWPEADGSLPTPWAENCWKVYLNELEDIERAIKYVEHNPIKEGRPAQAWPFVMRFDSMFFV